MSLYGRNVQAVTATSGTTAETTNGAPIGTWSRVNGGGTGTVTPANSPNSHFGNTSAGSRASIDVTMYGNDTPSAFTSGQSVGVFGVTPAQMANNAANFSKEHPAHTGWVLRRAGTGGVATATIAAGTNFVNGETVTVSNGIANATLSLTTNAAGVPTPGGVTVSNPGSGWVNTTMAAIAFNREKHLATVTFSAGAGDIGYDNTSVVTFSNASAFVNAYTANLATNATGGTVTTTIVEKGRFLNALVATDLVISIKKYDGTTATGNTTTTAISKTVVNSAAGTITLTLGGRAGRVQTETLIASGSLGAQSAGYGTPVSSNGLNSGTISQIYYPGL